MGKKLDALLGRNFKSSKFKSYVNLAISRMAFLEKQHRVRCQQARSDVVQLLNLGQNERALLRVEQVIREQNMLDAYVMIENYFNLLMERIVVLQSNKQCHDELKEAIASLIFAASRCGELPELQKIRGLLASRYGKELETRAVELRNNCGVNPKIAKKLSTRRPSLDSKLKTLKEVAPTHDISNLFEGGSSRISDEKMDAQEQQVQHEATSAKIDKSKLEDQTRNSGFKLKLDEKPSERKNARKRYGDAASAAQAAYKFAADAAEAARATVQLARPHRHDSDDQSTSSQETNLLRRDESSKYTEKVEGDATRKENKEANKGIKPSDNNNGSHHKESEERYMMPELEKFIVDLSLGSSSGSFTASVKNQENTGPERNCIQPPKARASQVHPTMEDKSNVVITHNKDSAEKSGLTRPNFGRRPHSVRTRRAYRMRSM